MSEAYPVRASYPHWETGMPLKRRRAKSPKPSFRPNKTQSKTQNRTVKKPRVHDSNETTSFEESIVSETSNSNVEVKMLMPTISGLVEAARILRCGTSSLSHGIVSIPTETLYSFSCYVAFRRRKAMVGPSSWKSLNNLVTSERLTTSRPHILLHNSSQAFEMVKFSTPKTFVHKHVKECGSDNNNGATPQVTWRAIKFSESYEVLKRLSSTFWPGTSTIYAPVRLRATKSKARMSDSQDSSSTSSSNPPGGSISSLSSESNENKSHLESSCDPSFPILPNSALLSKGELFQERGKEDGTYYVGMRCPSHPLTRRLLANAYSSGNIPHDKSDVKMKPLRGAVVGISPQLHVSKGARSNSNPVTAEIVRENLASPQHSDTVDEQPKATIHVLNGEDTKECFSVPSCQFADSPSASMIIDSPTRTVFIRRERKLPQASSSERSPSDVTAQDVLDVLHQVTRQPDEGSAKLKVIDAIMQKWTVVEL